MKNGLFTEPTSIEISDRLREIRISRGLSLFEIEKSSRGRLKAATLGSYERSDRSLSISRAIEIAQFYQIPLSYLLTGSAENTDPSSGQEYIFDLRRIRENNLVDPGIDALIHFLGHIAKRRSDWNGEILSIRSSDLMTLAILLHLPESEVSRWLQEKQLLLKQSKEPSHL
jgi:transcriptional regulator with XRE-family HTH domain